MTNADFGQLHRKPQKKEQTFITWKSFLLLIAISLALSAYINSFSKQSYIIVPVAHATDQQLMYEEEYLSSQK